jgi:hypothetical protein
MRLSHETVKLLIELGDKDAAEVFKDIVKNPTLETYLVANPFGTSRSLAYLSAYHMGDYSYLFRSVTIES